METQYADKIEQFAERLAGRAKYGFAGEKPIAVWALTCAARQMDRRLTGLDLLREHTDQVRTHFLRLADMYGRMKDATASWSVITGSAQELQRALTSAREANEAFAHLDPEDLAQLEGWFQERSSAEGPGATSAVHEATNSKRAPRPTSPAPVGVGWEVRLSESANCVEAWSRFRLPFEPKGESLEYREQLKAAISGLRAASTALVEAEYVSPSLPSNCDVENVLFYNVGAGAFASVARAGLSFAYHQGQGPLAPNGEIFDHYVRYRVQQGEGQEPNGRWIDLPARNVGQRVLQCR